MIGMNLFLIHLIRTRETIIMNVKIEQPSSQAKTSCKQVEPNGQVYVAADSAIVDALFCSCS